LIGMKVIVNKTEITIFSGARVADALRSYYIQLKKPVPKNLPEVKDRYGNTIASDGRLSEGYQIIINNNKERVKQ
jgi:hypothetical protein